MAHLFNRNVLVGVSGGIAAYKSAELVRQLQQLGATVRVIMTRGAHEFITELTLQALSGNPVHSELLDPGAELGMGHIELARWADVLVAAPATADLLARLAAGRADDLLTTVALATAAPLLLAPAMNQQMWRDKATAANVATLAARGHTLVGPASGEQACGEVGAGRMLEPAEILDAVIAFFTPKLLAGKQVLITAGPTFEAIDPVRGITNLSSGRMGYAVARAAQQAGALVTLVSGPVGFSAPQGVDRINVRSALDMHAAVMAHVARADIFIGVAAVADYRVANRAEHKLKKDAGGIPPIELIETPDILAEVAALEDAPFCVGFAAESQNLEAYAQAKRRRKKIPLIAGNLIQDGFGGDDNRLVLFDDAGVHPLNPAPKSVLARQLIEHIANLTGKN